MNCENTSDFSVEGVNCNRWISWSILADEPLEMSFVSSGLLSRTGFCVSSVGGGASSKSSVEIGRRSFGAFVRNGNVGVRIGQHTMGHIGSLERASVILLEC